ncbi:endonuclease III [Candidatus Micrarchaeota archaeon]|nr:endonuclease III [Candidatus Micrarchaeota archaeon]
MRGGAHPRVSLVNEDKIEYILKIMEQEAKLRGAPVFRVEGAKATPFQILVFTMLSARTKDERTMKVVERLFETADSPEKILGLKDAKLEKLLYGVGFYRTKTKNLKKTCKMLIEEFHSEIPDSLEKMLKLPGVGRKTANIVLARVHGHCSLGVDTHVHRISNRLGLTKTKKPEQTEKRLMKKIDKKYIRDLNRVFVAYGQTVCTPVSPFCSFCKLNKICPKIGVKKSR